MRVRPNLTNFFFYLKSPKLTCISRSLNDLRKPLLTGTIMFIRMPSADKLSRVLDWVVTKSSAGNAA